MPTLLSLLVRAVHLGWMLTLGALPLGAPAVVLEYGWTIEWTSGALAGSTWQGRFSHDADNGRLEGQRPGPVMGQSIVDADGTLVFARFCDGEGRIGCYGPSLNAQFSLARPVTTNYQGSDGVTSLTVLGPISPVPEPAKAALLLVGAATLVLVHVRARRQPNR
jgi:hypothetical protein